MTKANKDFTDYDSLKKQLRPQSFKSSTDLKAIPKFNEHGDNVDPIIRLIPVHSIDEYRFNPRQADNDHFLEIKESILNVGLQQRFSVTRNPQTKRYTLVKGGNTRLRVYKELYRETGEVKFSSIECIVEPWHGELNKAQAVIAHLIENEARGELILVDKARALIELEQEYKQNGAESLTSGQTKLEKHNIPTTTQEFVGYLKKNGYSVSEKQLGLFRFTATKLTGNLDYFLNQGLGSPQIIKIRAVYNNLKRIVKDVDLFDYDTKSLDADVAPALKKYNKTKKPFDFDRLLNVLVEQLSGLYPFLDIFGNDNAVFKQELLSTKKTKIKPESAAKDAGQSEQSAGTDVIENFNAQVVFPPENQADIEEIATSTKNDGGQIAAVVDKIDAPAAQVDTSVSAGINLNPEIASGVSSVMRLDFYRKQAYVVISKITNKLHIGKTVEQISTGCGFLLVDLVDESKSDFEHWGVWWLLLGYSHAADLLNPIDLEKLELADVEINPELLTLYTNTNRSDVDLVDESLSKIEQTSGMYEFRSPNLQSVKDRLVPHMWQDITELESVCYQITRVAISESMGIWE